MGNTDGKPSAAESVYFAWLKAAFPALYLAFKSRRIDRINYAVDEIKATYPTLANKDMDSILYWIEKQRISRVKLYEAVALKEFPQSCKRFSTVFRCEINSVPVVAFIDTGSEKTFIGKCLAKECGILQLMDMDPKYCAKAFGVGEGALIGKVHLCSIKIKDKSLPHAVTTNFPVSIMDQFHLKCLMLGIDFLKHYQAVLNYNDNKMILERLNITIQFETNLCPCCFLPFDLTSREGSKCEINSLTRGFHGKTALWL